MRDNKNTEIRITCISDTHGYHDGVNIEPTDILLFAGDCMTTGYNVQQLVDFLDWFKEQPSRHKIMIAGNHDRYFENHPKESKELFKKYPNITYLEDVFTIVEGLKIYGTPHSKIFYNWAFNRTEDEMTTLFAHIPADTDILLSHAPQHGVLDQIIGGDSVGEKPLKERMKQLKNLKLHVFGHIHASFGMVKPHGKHISVNASQVDEAYDLVNFPITLKI